MTLAEKISKGKKLFVAQSEATNKCVDYQFHGKGIDYIMRDGSIATLDYESGSMIVKK